MSGGLGLKAVMVLVGSVFVLGQDPEVLPGKKPIPGVVRAVEQVGRAAQMVAHARERRSVALMLGAMELLGEVRIRPDPARFGRKQGEGGGETVARDQSLPSLELDDLAREAKVWAASDPGLLKLIDVSLDRIRHLGSGTLGASGGPIYHADRVQARHVDIFRVRYAGGEPARIEVVGDGGTDLDLVVLDENGREVCRDLEVSDRCRAEWVPPKSAIYTVRILNREEEACGYVLVTN